MNNKYLQHMKYINNITPTFLFLVTILLATCNTTTNQELENLLSPGSLPYLKNAKQIQVSSYDTTGSNNDRINIHKGETAIIFDESGPGVITRICITIDSRDPYFLSRILLRMYWDNEESPSVEVPVLYKGSKIWRCFSFIK